MQKKLSISKERSKKYEGKLKVNGSFIDIMNAATKQAKTKLAKKSD